VQARIFAEVKTKSPFGYVARESWDSLLALALQVGDVVSIHTDTRWGGSFEQLTEVCKSCVKPVLAKGLHQTNHEVEEAVVCGATAVLTVGFVPHPSLQPYCLYEPLRSTLQLTEVTGLMQGAVWNRRDLNTGRKKPETFDQARRAFTGFLVQASLIRTVKDVHDRADGVLVGTYLREFAESLSKPVV
jgi:indole-3-glycerol phosphate synthase